MTMKRLLVVDDDQVIRMLLLEYLSCSGFLVEAVENGSECLEKLSQELPDVLLLDFQMPDMSGLEVLQKIRENADLAQLPIIMLSANNDTERIVQENNLEADAYILKPFKMPDIIIAVKQVVN